MNYIYYIILILFICFIIVFFYYYSFNNNLSKGWECIEGNCVFIENGRHKNKKDCENKCYLNKD